MVSSVFNSGVSKQELVLRQSNGLLSLQLWGKQTTITKAEKTGTKPILQRRKQRLQRQQILYRHLSLVYIEKLRQASSFSTTKEVLVIVKRYCIIDDDARVLCHYSAFKHSRSPVFSAVNHQRAIELLLIVRPVESVPSFRVCFEPVHSEKIWSIVCCLLFLTYFSAPSLQRCKYLGWFHCCRIWDIAAAASDNRSRDSKELLLLVPS